MSLLSDVVIGQDSIFLFLCAVTVAMFVWGSSYQRHADYWRCRAEHWESEASTAYRDAEEAIDAKSVVRDLHRSDLEHIRDWCNRKLDDLAEETFADDEDE